MKFGYTIEHRLTGRHKKSFDFVGDVKDMVILDIGCSFGWFEKMAIENGCKNVIGIEPEEKFFYEAKREVPKAIFKRGSALDIPFKDKSFDIVVMFDVLEHLPKGTEMIALKEIKRVLKIGGKLILSTPLNHWWSNLMDLAWYFGHRHYSDKQLKKMLETVGFKIDKVEKRGGFFEMINIILLYIFKWIFKREIPFKRFFEKKREKEYFSKKNGFVTLFIKAVKIV